MSDTRTAIGQITTTDGTVLPVLSYTNDAYPHAHVALAIVPAVDATDPADRTTLFTAMHTLETDEDPS